MKLFNRDLTREVAFVAEIGVNHEGDIRAALRLVQEAAAAGADAVKLQTYSPLRFVSTSDRDRHARVTSFMLDEDAHRELAAEAARIGVPFFSSAITEDVVPLLAEIGCAIKIASGDLTFEPVIRAALATGRPVILSTGAASIQEIDTAVAWARDSVGASALPDRLVLLHCVSAYPAPLEEANVRSVPFLAERYGLLVGYSNHVPVIDACLAAIAVGAAVIEAHFTDRKDGRAFRDHQLSFEPKEFRDLVDHGRRIRAALGTHNKVIAPSERDGRDLMRKGVVAARDIEAGSVLERADLMYARPSTGFPWFELPTLVGRRLRSSLRVGELVTPAALLED
jgi:N,N'-diacetyllegionaminate synthase